MGGPGLLSDGGGEQPQGAQRAGFRVQGYLEAGDVVCHRWVPPRADTAASGCASTLRSAIPSSSAHSTGSPSPHELSGRDQSGHGTETGRDTTAADD